MTTDTQRTDTQKLRELLAKGTQGPWFMSGVRFKMDRSEWHRIMSYNESLNQDEDICCVGYDPRTGLGLADAALIVAAVNALPVMCDELDALRAERDRMREALNTPEVEDFTKAVVSEAQHQRERWGSSHDAGKQPLDWFWLIGYLAQKAATAAMAGDAHKAKHHTISTAAALANWHAAISGQHTEMRPGIDTPEFDRAALGETK